MCHNLFNNSPIDIYSSFSATILHAVINRPTIPIYSFPRGLFQWHRFPKVRMLGQKAGMF